MTNDDAVVNLFALAHPGRLNVFRTIVQAGPEGMAAGKIAKSVGIPANTASTHLSILTGAGLLSAYRDGRSIIYRADFGHYADLMRFMLSECSENHPGAAVALHDYFAAHPLPAA
ncbi:metalloregulator ArsR/SmtB family transcription factor [Asticcacaulis sp. EMRT-3]|uniref:ArsR/SmtB family transcription factor n=1 Tax=Asticcacaulis sp. EMRT-3 TaxID=3040349 RepID=UPI0024AEBD06|nr:metalloregulator ArsR/SmtB family transcription factor [Asticcacaulis sp. EMRT-3]MDI7775536.1 metalloregulator ArsR/SmtB family transcription factor [Asticcacaulis sp. EMRT-3]